MTTVTATEASRNFSELLNRVAAGEEIEIVRNGAPIAVISRPAQRFTTAEEWDAMMERLARLPPMDAEQFASDVEAARRELPPLRDPWQS